MIEQNNNKCSLGLDFRFTILQSFIPILEEENNIDIISFKSYIKNDSYLSKNGLNLYFNCLNNNCKYNNNCFIMNAGYGNYDIFSFINYNAYCPFCYKSKQDFFKEKNKLINNINDNNNLQLKYLGMMNAKWAYKGYLRGIKMTNAEGKGMTALKDILYKTKEFDFLSQFKRLLFEIERFNSKNIYNPNYSKCDNSFYSDNYNSNINNEIDKGNIDLQCDINDAKLNKNIFKEKEIIDIFNEINDNDNELNNDKYENHSNKIEKHSNLQVKDNQNESDKNNEKYNIKNEYSNNSIENNSSNINNTIINKNMYRNSNKELDTKINSNINKKNNNSKGTYYGNSKQALQNKDVNETYITNVGFNIIIDKTKTNCCENCFDIQQGSQVCSIY